MVNKEKKTQIHEFSRKQLDSCFSFMQAGWLLCWLENRSSIIMNNGVQIIVNVNKELLSNACTTYTLVYVHVRMHVSSGVLKK